MLWDTSGSIHIQLTLRKLIYAYIQIRTILLLPELLKILISSYMTLNGVKAHLRRWGLAYLFLSHLLRILWEAEVLSLKNHCHCLGWSLPAKLMWFLQACLLTVLLLPPSILSLNPCWSGLGLSLCTCLGTPIVPRHAFTHLCILETFI